MMLTWNGDEIIDKIHDELGDRLEKITQVVTDGIRTEAPVLTGFLKAETTTVLIDRDALHSRIKSNARYSGFVHEGRSPTGPRKPNRYFIRGIEASLDKCRNILIKG